MALKALHREQPFLANPSFYAMHDIFKFLPGTLSLI
jgi:hypothetical protein